MELEAECGVISGGIENSADGAMRPRKPRRPHDIYGNGYPRRAARCELNPPSEGSLSVGCFSWASFVDFRSSQSLANGESAKRGGFESTGAEHSSKLTQGPRYAGSFTAFARVAQSFRPPPLPCRPCFAVPVLPGLVTPSDVLRSSVAAPSSGSTWDIVFAFRPRFSFAGWW